MPPRGTSMLRPLLLLLLAASSLGCDVRNDLRGAARKTQHAPVVFAGTVRSRGTARHGFYQVTVDVESVVKGDAVGGGPMRLRFRRPPDDPAAAAGRRPVCVAEAVVEPGERYIVFVKAIGGPRNFTAVAAPEKHSRRNMRKVTRVLRRRRGRSPPRIAKMNSVRRVRVPAGRRLRLQCRVRGTPLPKVTWFHEGKPVVANRRVRFRTKKRKRQLQSMLVIRRAAPRDAGLYQCRAKNRVGEAEKNTTVSVGRRRVRPPPRPQPIGPDKPRPPDSWRAAEACDIPSYCLNGGSCTLYRSVMEYVCQCAEGFKGKRCERKTVYAIKHRGVDPNAETVRSPWQQAKPRSRRRRHRRR